MGTVPRPNSPKRRLPEAHIELTLAQGSRPKSVVLRPFAFYAVVGLMSFFGLTALAVPSYLVFHNEELTVLMSRQIAQQQHAYDHRLAALRLENALLARARSRDRAAYAARIRALTLRQARLEHRALALAVLAHRAGLGTLPSRATFVAEAKPPPAGKRSPIPPSAASAFLTTAPASRFLTRRPPPTAKGKPQPQATEVRSDSSDPLLQTPMAKGDRLESRLGTARDFSDWIQRTRTNDVRTLGRAGQTALALRGALPDMESGRLKPAHSQAESANGGPSILVKADAERSPHGRGLGEWRSDPAAPRQTPTVRPSSAADTAPIDLRLGAVKTSLDKIERLQIKDVAALGSVARRKAAKVRRALAETGLETNRLKLPADAKADDGIGGPYIPLKPDAGKSPFEHAVFQVEENLLKTNRLERLLSYLPLRQPLAGRLQVTSPFGSRIDPFFGRPALHPGVDLRAAYGTPVFATAAGKVMIAGPDGGYGNLVEIRHGNGLMTRYGHLSSILVKDGEMVAAGQVIGKAGSTGRSTGPHLHYEVRVDGEPVDPMRFLKAGRTLGADERKG